MATVKDIIKRLMPAVLLEALQRYIGKRRTLRQLAITFKGSRQKLLLDDFFVQRPPDNPHALDFVRYYLGYNYRVLHALLLRADRLPRYLPKQELEAIISYTTQHNTTQAPSRRVLCLSYMAILPLQNDAEQTAAFLQKSIGPKGRNMLRKAQKNGYCVRPIEYDEHLDEIFAINTSKKERQGRPMAAAYRCYPQRRSAALRRLGIEYHCFGCFEQNSGKLMAYAGFYRFGQLFRIDKVLGHGEHLCYGIMNLLFAELAGLLAASHPNSYLNYLTMNTLGGFKARLGFAPYNLLYFLPDTDFKNSLKNFLKHPAHMEPLLRAVRRSRATDWGGDWVGRYLEQAAASPIDV